MADDLVPYSECKVGKVWVMCCWVSHTTHQQNTTALPRCTSLLDHPFYTCLDCFHFQCWFRDGTTMTHHYPFITKEALNRLFWPTVKWADVNVQHPVRLLKFTLGMKRWLFGGDTFVPFMTFRASLLEHFILQVCLAIVHLRTIMPKVP